MGDIAPDNKYAEGNGPSAHLMDSEIKKTELPIPHPLPRLYIYQGPPAHALPTMTPTPILNSPTQSTNPYRPVHRATPATEATVTHGGSSTYVNNINSTYTRTVSVSPGVPPHKPAHNSNTGSVPPVASSQGTIPSLNEHHVPLPASPAPLAPAQSAHAPSAPPDTIATTPLQDDTVGSPVEKFMVLLGCPTSPGGLDRDAIKPADQVDDFSSRITSKTGADESTRVFSEEEKHLIQAKREAYESCRNNWQSAIHNRQAPAAKLVPLWQNFSVEADQNRKEIGWGAVLRSYIRDRAKLWDELKFWPRVLQYIEKTGPASWANS